MTHPDPHRPTLRDDDLVARALDALPDGERARVDAALEQDARARARFETIAAHLLAYDQLPPAPPPPAFARLAAAIDADEGTPDLTILALQDAPPRPRRWRVAALAAAVLLCGLLGWQLLPRQLLPWQGPRAPDTLALIPGAGLELVAADGERRPAPARAALTVQAGDVITGHEPAEAHLDGRVRLVLDAEARVRIEDAAAVRLEAGRAWFEVAPGRFAVHTAHGPVRVLGTAFEVDVRGGALRVAVGHGRVAAGGHEIGAGMHLAEGAVAASPFPAGAWFRQPRLRVRLAEGATPRAGAPLRLEVVLENPGRVAIPLRRPSDVRHALWLHLQTADGRPVAELPVLAAHLRGPAGFLEPGVESTLLPGRPLRVSIEIPAPFTSPGTYLCRALYRPAGRPGVLSDARRLEVR